MTSIVITCQFEATHNWPGVVDHEELKDVFFLQYPHRHIFHIQASKLVTHDDRDVEIIMLKREIERYLQDVYPGGNLGSTSCEMLAGELANKFNLNACTVLEDGENGAMYVREA